MTFLFARHALLPDGWHEDVAIEIGSDGTFSSVEQDTGPRQGERVGFVVPGMPNLHSHAFQRALAGRAEFSISQTDSFWTWRDLMYRLANHLDSKEVETIAQYAYIEMIKAGYTSVAEFHYVHRDSDDEKIPGLAMAQAILRASDFSGIGLTLLPVVYQRSGFSSFTVDDHQRRFHLTTDEYIQLYKNLADNLKSKSKQRLGLAFHSLRAVDDHNISLCLKAINEIDPYFPKHIHIAEQQQEVDDCVTHTGQRPVDHLASVVDFDKTWCLVHATHMSDGESELVTKSGAVTGLCPTTEANLGDGIFPLTRYLEKGGRYGIGSDSQVSLSSIEELRTLEYTNRLTEHRRLISARVSTPHCGDALWRDALLGGAQALGQNVGAIKTGRRADVLVLNEDSPSLIGHGPQSVLDGLVFGAPQSAIQHVMIDGKWVVRDGRHDQEEQAFSDFRRLIERLAPRVNNRH